MDVEAKPGVNPFRAIRLLATLPRDERDARIYRVLHRWKCRRRLLRRLGRVSPHPSWRTLERLSGLGPEGLAERLRESGPSRGPLFGDLPRRAALVHQASPDHARLLAEQARRLLRREFDLLGSGPVRPLREDGGLDWHLDWRSGVRWDPDAYYLDVPIVRGDGSDIKVPWELGRFQHLQVFAQVYHLAPLAGLDDAEELRRAVARESRDQILDFIRRNPPGVGLHWACAMEAAIRAYNWVTALAFFRDAPEWDDAFLAELGRSLWAHGLHIRANLEIGRDGLTSNHYLADLVGLLAIGTAAPALPGADAWRGFAAREIRREIRVQVHADGVDFERSLPYHRLVCEMFLHAGLWMECAGMDPGAAYRDRVRKMLAFTHEATRPDWTVAQWGDNDDGRLLPLEGYATHEPHDHRHLMALGGVWLGWRELAEAGWARPAEACWLTGSGLLRPGKPGARHPVAAAFPEARVYVLRCAQAHVTVPCGPVGTRGEGNHTHNDLFACVAWAGGREWITDPGSGVYSADPALRNRLRSTESHAVFQVERLEQNPLGEGIEGLFRVYERAEPVVTRWEPGAEATVLEAEHTGFRDAQARWKHRRRLTLLAEGPVLFVSDEVQRLEGEAPAWGTAWFPLAPGLRVRVDVEPAEVPDPIRHHLPAGQASARWVEVRDPRGPVLWVGTTGPAGQRFSLERVPYSPRYGVVAATSRLGASYPLDSGTTRIYTVLGWVLEALS